MNLFHLKKSFSFCDSSAQSRNLGEVLRHALLTTSVPKSSITAFLRESLRLPLGVAAYNSLRRCRIKDFAQSWVRIRSHKRRHKKPHAVDYGVLLPNVWMGNVHRRSIESFLKLSDKDIISRLECELKIFKGFSLDLQTIFAALEATLPGHFSPLLICICNFQFDAAQPRILNFEAKEIYPIESIVRRNSIQNKIFSEWHNQLITYRKEQKGATAEKFIQEKRKQVDGLADENTRILCKAMLEFIRKPSNASFSYPERVLRSMPKMLSALLDSKEEIPERIYSHDIDALNALIKIHEPKITQIKPDRIKQLRKRSKLFPRTYDIVSPNLVFSEYGLDKPLPAPNDLRASAERILLNILFYFGRRARCLLNIRLRHLQFFNDLVQIIIPDTKTDDDKMMRLPVNPFWSSQERQHLISFIEATSHLSPETRLIQIAGICKDETLDADTMQRRLCKALSESDKIHSTHVPRITFATFFPIRIMCALEPTLLQHPLVHPYKDHPWFSEEMLSNIRELAPNETTDSLEIMRRITGHASTKELISSYIRSWSILLALEDSLATNKPISFAPYFPPELKRKLS